MEVSRAGARQVIALAVRESAPCLSIRGQRSLYVHRPGVARIRRPPLTDPGGGPRIRESSTSKESMRMAWP
jgi:hypothetical protein